MTGEAVTVEIVVTVSLGSVVILTVIVVGDGMFRHEHSCEISVGFWPLTHAGVACAETPRAFNPGESVVALKTVAAVAQVTGVYEVEYVVDVEVCKQSWIRCDHSTSAC